MSDDVTSSAWRFTLRGNQDDKAIVQRTIEAHRSMGINLSLNEAILVLIRRSATPDADSQEEAWQQIEQHWSKCSHGCDYNNVKCPDGWRLRDAFHRVKPRDPRWKPRRPAAHTPPANPSPTPPPPPTPDPAEEDGWRRHFAFGIAGRKAG